jgi:hypothetical protein
MNSHKFSSLVGSEFVPYLYSNVWAREKTSGPHRLVIAPSSNQIELVTTLAEILPEPFGVLYIVLVSRLDNALGRYQCPAPCTRDELKAFLSEFKQYFESDGRHHVWVSSLPLHATLVYDQHNVIYAYGPLQHFEQVLRNMGLTEGGVAFPEPHAHNYNAKYDEEERRILDYWEWRQSPLMEGD